MEKQKRTYSPEFKIKAVELCNHRGNLQSVASELDVSAKNLSRWKQEHGAGKLDGTSRPAVPKSREELENVALRKALREAELERDILKKALCISPRATGKVQLHPGQPDRISCREDVQRIQGEQERLLQMAAQNAG